jgi:hypothetical protein
MRLTPQALFGLLVVGFGLALTGENLDLFYADDLLRYAPLGLVAVGLLKVAQSTGTSGRLAGGLLTSFGLLLSAEWILGWNVQVQDWWPLVLVALGIVILTRSLRGPTSGDPAAAHAQVSEVAVWSGKVRRNASSAFQRADLTAVMGGVELDLRGASTAPGGAVIDVFVMWGGIEIWVPPDWSVANEVVVLMGGAEDKSSGVQDARNRLTVRGFCIMGGVEIGPKP